jgi:hypothetical protein
MGIVIMNYATSDTVNGNSGVSGMRNGLSNLGQKNRSPSLTNFGELKEHLDALHVAGITPLWSHSDFVGEGIIFQREYGGDRSASP